ncbi:HAMP domain-containing histidine kinase [Apibacter muscae]|uniref:sensor histidine kinase n=1 Tax=Apibacter muscae TaxID=2509004 RepID=UPI0011ACF2DF|nr:HAMP domain-containing sensor histidine kinase [Apibacter muscae]TWP30346.1 HAMP domain-containing histidine kinase [Apibacter muscae]
MYKRFPLSLRIFLVIILVVVSSMFAMGLITFYQYVRIAREYNNKKLERKEQLIVETFDYLLSKKNTASSEVKDKIGNKIYEISDINNLDINFYSLNGNFLLGNKIPDASTKFIPKEYLKSLSINNDRIKINKKSALTGENYATIYRYIYNNNYEPIAIINFPFLHDEFFLKKDFHTLLYRYLVIMLIVLVVSGVFSWFFSQTLTRKIKDLAQRLSDTGALTNNRPILYNYIDEISPLVKAYNIMLVKFKEQTDALIKSEKDSAWQQMARQVAHEIKNPLTPMRLEIQSFQLRFNPEDPEIKDKLNKLIRSLITQIDTIASIAEAFSDFAKMSIKKDEKINVLEIAKNSLEIFPSQYIEIVAEENIILNFDPNLLNRILTNLVKNAFQAIPENQTPEIAVKIAQDNYNVYFFVIDNGTGIPEEIQSKIFTPQFSTKSSGSGLGLAIIKKIIEEYNGSINFTSEEGVGSVFKFEIPKGE